jgi:hypothetical protein
MNWDLHLLLTAPGKKGGQIGQNSKLQLSVCTGGVSFHDVTAERE